MDVFNYHAVLFLTEEIAQQLRGLGVTAIFGVAQMAETLKKVAQLCPTVRRVILLGPPQEGCISFQQMIQDSGDLFNENLDVNLFLNYEIFLLIIKTNCWHSKLIDCRRRRHIRFTTFERDDW